MSPTGMLAASLLEFHKDWAWAVVLGNAAAGAWSLAAHWIRRLQSKILWAFIALAEVAIAVQAILGVAVVNREGFELPRFHAFYGFVALAAVAIIYSYRPQLKGREYLLYGLGSWFLMGLGIRAMVLG